MAKKYKKLDRPRSRTIFRSSNKQGTLPSSSRGDNQCLKPSEVPKEKDTEVGNMANTTLRSSLMMRLGTHGWTQKLARHRGKHSLLRKIQTHNTLLKKQEYCHCGIQIYYVFKTDVIFTCITEKLGKHLYVFFKPFLSSWP